MDRAKLVEELRSEAKRLTMAADLLESDGQVAPAPAAEALPPTSHLPARRQYVSRISGRPAAAKRAYNRRSPYPAAPKKRTMSPETRAKLAAAQKARWAKVKGVAS